MCVECKWSWCDGDKVSRDVSEGESGDGVMFVVEDLLPDVGKGQFSEL